MKYTFTLDKNQLEYLFYAIEDAIIQAKQEAELYKGYKEEKENIEFAENYQQVFELLQKQHEQQKNKSNN